MAHNAKRAKTIRDKTNRAKMRMLAALEKTLGIISTACKKTRVSRTQHYLWMDEDEDYRAKVLDVKEIQKDFAESCLMQSIKALDGGNIRYYMSTQCKDRGYGPTEIHVTGETGVLMVPLPQSVDEWENKKAPSTNSDPRW